MQTHWVICLTFKASTYDQCHTLCDICTAYVMSVHVSKIISVKPETRPKNRQTNERSKLGFLGVHFVQINK